MSGGQRGSAGVLAVLGCAVVVAATVGVLGWGSALESRQRAEAAADSAALAAAQASLAGGDGCAAAHRVARAMAATVQECTVDPSSVAAVTVTVGLRLGWLRALDMPPARARARAGVPP